ncbi:MAG: aminotransferase class III-fold pyridoxal phosphate-dependent enzyme [Armatimonadetes bacterium]|nr:aminotransferase class III-fold pyridoxal phosphate-dependent enzyme [Armatimonadota bacterium]
MSFKRSEKLLGRARKSLAGGVSSHFRALDKPFPMFFEKARGATIVDADGNRYLDYTLSQGPMILGHSCPEILKAVRAELARGQLFAGQHEGEIRLAELFQRHVPCADMTRFSLTGSEAIQTVLRLARAHTNRVKYIKFEGHYHGWFDNVLISVAPAASDAGPEESPEAVGMTAAPTESRCRERSSCRRSR